MRVALEVALVLNIITTLYLKPWRVLVRQIAAVRLSRRISAYRVAGLLLVLVAVSHAQKPVVGVIHDQDYELARAIAKANGIDVSSSEWNAQTGTTYSRGEDVLLRPQPKYESTTGFPVLDNAIRFVWNNSGKLILMVGFLVLIIQFGFGGKESNDTNINDLADPDYRTGFVSNYHGDDAFEVPDGMRSEHTPVPVRSRSASAGR